MVSAIFHLVVRMTVCFLVNALKCCLFSVFSLSIMDSHFKSAWKFTHCVIFLSLGKYLNVNVVLDHKRVSVYTNRVSIEEDCPNCLIYLFKCFQIAFVSLVFAKTICGASNSRNNSSEPRFSVSASCLGPCCEAAVLTCPTWTCPGTPSLTGGPSHHVSNPVGVKKFIFAAPLDISAPDAANRGHIIYFLQPNLCSQFWTSLL